VFVALGIHHAMRMRHIVICGRFGSITFFHIFGKQKFVEHQICVLFLPTTFFLNFKKGSGGLYH
jgi:hypothetical protein